MSESRFVEVVLALVGVWLVVRYIPDFLTVLYVTSVNSADTTIGMSPIVFQAVRLGSSVLFGALAIVCRRRLGRWLDAGQDPLRLDPRGLLLAGCLLLAGFFAISGVISMGSHLAMAGYRPQDSFHLAYGFFSFVLGTLLFVSTGLVSRWWSYIYERT